MSDAISENKRLPPGLPPRPVKPSQTLGNAATDRQAKEHYSVMLDYWIQEAQWQQERADRLQAILDGAFL